VTEGGVDEAEESHEVPRIDDARLVELFGRQVLADPVRKELLSPGWADRLLSWRHTGFNVHSRVRAKTKREAERYYDLYANAHRGKVKKASLGPFPLRMVEDLQPIPSKGWAEMIHKVYEVDALLCPRCGGRMKIIAFLTDYAIVDHIINHLKLTFVAERPRRLRSSISKFWWLPRPRLSILRDSVFPWARRSG